MKTIPWTVNVNQTRAGQWKRKCIIIPYSLYDPLTKYSKYHRLITPSPSIETSFCAYIQFCMHQLVMISEQKVSGYYRKEKAVNLQHCALSKLISAFKSAAFSISIWKGPQLEATECNCWEVQEVENSESIKAVSGKTTHFSKSRLHNRKCRHLAECRNVI